MSKILVVFGATGQQGGSIIKSVLQDPELSKTYQIRAVTRDPSSESSKILGAQGIVVVQGDLNDIESIPSVVRGANTVFLMGAPSFGLDAKAMEIAQGKAAADAAVTAGVSYLIYSTLPHVERISGGKYTKVSGFDAKAEVEEYIRSLPIKSAFFAPGSFMQNWHTMMKPQPDPAELGSFVISRHVSPVTQLPLIDTAGDTGKYVGAILADPEKHVGKTFCSASGLYTMDEIAKIISQQTGKSVTYKQMSTEDFRKTVPPFYADILEEMMLYQQDFGYYGKDTKDLVQWAVDNARGKASSFEEYLAANPLQL